MATTAFKLSSKVDSNNRSQVIVKLTLSRNNRPCFKTGVLVAPEWFRVINETKKGVVFGIVPPKKGRLNLAEVREAEAAKAALDVYSIKLVAVANALTSRGEEVTHEQIEAAMAATRDMDAAGVNYNVVKAAVKEQEEKAQKKTFFEWYDLFLQRKELGEGRKRSYRVLGRILARYEMFVRLTDKKRKDFALDVDTIDRETLEDFFDYVAAESELAEENPAIFKKIIAHYPEELATKNNRVKIEERGHNILIGRKKNLKTFFRWLNAHEYTKNEPFKGLTIEAEKYGTPYYLTLAERNKMAEFDLSNNKRLEVQRDIFLFQCLIGCRVSDLLSLTPENLTDADGVTSIEYIPRKTKDHTPVVVTVPLNTRALALVQKYKGADKKGRLFPFIDSQLYNEAIKDVLRFCGITRRVQIINPTTGKTEQKRICDIASSHMARRTFIGGLYGKVKDPNLIGKLSGHAEGSRAFVRYRDIDTNIMAETVALID